MITTLGVATRYMVSRFKKEEDTIKKVNKDLDQIFRTAADGMRVVDKNFTVLRINKTLVNMIGITENGALGKKCYETFPGSFCHTSKCPLTRILNGDKYVECDAEKKRKDGAKISCIVTATPFKDPAGELIGIVEDFKDITERKKSEKELKKYRSRLEELVKERTVELASANEQLQQEIIEHRKLEDALRNSEESYRRLAQNLPGIVYRVFLREKKWMQFFNNMLQPMTGYTIEELREGEVCRIEDLILYQDRKNVIIAINHAIKNDRPFEVEYRLRHKEGEIRYFIERGRPIRGADGKPFCLEGVIFDITDRKQTEALLRESEAKYSTLVQKAKDGVAIVQDGLLKFFNQAIIKITGYTDEELQDTPFLDLVAPEVRDQIAQGAQGDKLPITWENIPSFYESKIKRKDGMIREVESSVGPIQYNGKPAVMVITRDVTEHKRMEEELQKIQKLESLGILAGGIAHDFNNLLTTILGNLSLVELYAKSGNNIFGVLEETKKASHQTKHLTQQLLTFAKGGEPVKKNISISKLLKDTASLALSGSKVRCELSMPDDLWWTEIDDGQINQAINNIIINSDQAMPEGGIIKISAKNVLINSEDGLPLAEGKYIKISIQDQGIGLAEEYLFKIFDPYFTTKSKGSGLGLTITFSIIKTHKGYLTVESKLGVGTTFYIYLPATKKEIFALENIMEEKLLCGNGRILFMDDQESIRNVIGGL